ncbi:MAG: hypothetical protein BWY46_00292 [Firmicutes bacterium ADurb.Bin300]|nr:MAG: hypothetical protein BWY46_00292 [Firmicutes bacterium ADurb.Bin300]HOD02449.1 NAD(P)/FAD-dependent oxidoreductase [Clostridiales bacterium]
MWKIRKKIIVAGAGHGGIPAAAALAKVGFDVTVYERGSRDKLGYDWTDIFDPKALSYAGIDMPPKDKYEYKTNMTFFGPSEKVGIHQQVPDDPDVMEIKMERSDIYTHLINHALDCGVKFEYGVNISGPIMQNNRVVGIKTDKGDILGDMVIDSCGCESVVRANLPDSCGIQKSPRRFEKFYVFRAFYDLGADYESIKDRYKVMLLPKGKLGIGWLAAEEDYCDLLIGRFDPFDMTEVERTAAAYRKANPQLGTTLRRGGQFVEIPVRQPLSVMVADGYAAIGDAAFMTVPVIGSGIGNSLKASKILAETIINDETGTYKAQTLWKYQRDYYKLLGAGLAPLACVKLVLTRITPQELDYLIDNGILTAEEMTITANDTSLGSFINFDMELIRRGAKLFKNGPLTKKLLRVVGDIVKTTVVTNILMPKEYSRSAVQKWAKRYDEIFISDN